MADDRFAISHVAALYAAAQQLCGTVALRIVADFEERYRRPASIADLRKWYPYHIRARYLGDAPTVLTRHNNATSLWWSDAEYAMLEIPRLAKSVASLVEGQLDNRHPGMFRVFVLDSPETPTEIKQPLGVVVVLREDVC